MLCEKCKQREATVHKQVIINGIAHSEHLCAECAAKERGGRDPFASFFHNAFFADRLFERSFGDWLEPFFQRTEGQMPQVEGGIGPCPECGMSWDDFQRNGFLGCSGCYDHFKDVLPPLMRELHNVEPETRENTAPAGSQTPMSAKERLQAELTRAIAEENFEEAAHLRDAIKALEETDKGNTGT